MRQSNWKWRRSRSLVRQDRLPETVAYRDAQGTSRSSRRSTHFDDLVALNQAADDLLSGLLPKVMEHEVVKVGVSQAELIEQDADPFLRVGLEQRLHRGVRTCRDAVDDGEVDSRDLAATVRVDRSDAPRLFRKSHPPFLRAIATVRASNTLLQPWSDRLSALHNRRLATLGPSAVTGTPPLVWLSIQ